MQGVITYAACAATSLSKARMPASALNREPAPLIWTNALMFALTFAVAAVVVPWWGFRHGFSAADWGCFVFLTAANGIAITAGYHRLWAHRTYEAHWSVRLVYLVFGTMALQNSALRLVQRASQPPPATSTTSTSTRTRRGAASGSRTSAGCCASTRAASPTSPTSRT